MSMTTPPGRYPDPGLPSTERWWDGTARTGHVRQPGAGLPPWPPSGGKRRNGPLLALAAGAALAAVIVTVAVNPFGDGDRDRAAATGSASDRPSATLPGDSVQSLVFPSTVGTESLVVVRFAFEAGPEAPPLTGTDEIARSIRPIGDASGGGDSSIGP
ncbi:DUF2510 domain-containing protein [Streptomyces sp. NPDC087850]|uniref:DUF2510 domain-containing protein n=1 Tax=Streptomyces sp. NPDC087850 TaxID=3365809 RepID=UPI0037F45D4E